MESRAFESRIKLNESRIPLMTGIRILSSTDKESMQNPVPCLDLESKSVLDSLTWVDVMFWCQLGCFSFGESTVIYLIWDSLDLLLIKWILFTDGNVGAMWWE